MKSVMSTCLNLGGEGAGVAGLEVVGRCTLDHWKWSFGCKYLAENFFIVGYFELW